MSQEGAAKLRLKARKAPPEPSPGQEPPGRRQTVTDKCCWFEKEDLSESEKTWRLLVEAVNPDLKCTPWQTVPSFPEFSRKSSEEENLQQSEVFKFGMKDFQWISFPPFHKEKYPHPDLSSSQITESQTNHLLEVYSQADEPESLSSTAEKACCVTFKDHIKNTVEESSKGISKLDANPQSYKLSQHKYSMYHMASAQSSAKPLGFPQPCRGTTQNSKEREESSSSMSQAQTHEGSISFGEARSIPTERNSLLVSMPGSESCNRKTKDHREGALALDSCPICLMQFNGMLSQLDIDGHLARCLSESADDVVW